jgi:hypothetical protein
MLKGVLNNFGSHFGIKCSSFCKVNIGTSMRSACSSMGFASYDSVSMSNKLLERILVVISIVFDCVCFLVICMGFQLSYQKVNMINGTINVQTASR